MAPFSKSSKVCTENPLQGSADLLAKLHTAMTRNSSEKKLKFSWFCCVEITAAHETQLDALAEL